MKNLGMSSQQPKTMGSRGNYYDRTSPSWESYDEHHGRPPPQRRGPPPPQYNEYDHPPPRHPDDRLQPPRHLDDQPPQRFYEDELPYDEFNRKGVHQRPLKSSQGQPPENQRGRGRGRAQNGAGRGQSYSRGRGSTNSFNGPKQPPKGEKTPSKPAWLSKPTTTTAITATRSSSTMPSKPAWLSQSVASSASLTSSSSKPAWMTQSSESTANASTTKPAWLSQSVASTTSSTSSSSSKPAWMKPAASNASYNASTSKPAWLTQTGLSTSNSNTTSSKPAWISQPVNKAVTTTSNSLSNKPSWMTQAAASWKPKPSPKPAWLSHPVQPSTANHVSSKANTPLAPPPPPSHPPPPNQPRIQPTQQQAPCAIPPKPQTNQGKPKKPKTKAQQAEIKVPGPSNGAFISFKNSLQEYCQKKALAVPVYRSFKSNYGYSATVELSDGKKFHTQSIQRDKKEAEQFAALETLKSLGILPLETTFINPPKPQLGTKRVKPTPAAVAKKLKLGTNAPPSNSPNYKCQLNEFCQKFHLPIPTYETTNNGFGFVTTLVYNSKVYMSTAPQASKKDAEQNVAQLALSKVNQAPPPSEPRQGPVVYPNFVVASSNPEGSTNSTTTAQDDKPEQPNTTIIPVRSVQDLTAQNITPSISYKNKLQEACQKQKTVLPVYESTREDKFYSCTVTIQGQVFTATGCKTKKGSEQSAARVALQALGLLSE